MAAKIRVLPNAGCTVLESEAHSVITDRTYRERLAFEHGDIVLDAMTVVLDSIHP
jgi:hypothetical protein